MPKKQRIYNYFYEFASEALHIVIFENFIKSMTSCLSKLKVTFSFCFAFKIPDDPTATNIQTKLQFWALIENVLKLRFVKKTSKVAKGNTINLDKISNLEISICCLKKRMFPNIGHIRRTTYKTDILGLVSFLKQFISWKCTQFGIAHCKIWGRSTKKDEYIP